MRRPPVLRYRHRGAVSDWSAFRPLRRDVSSITVLEKRETYRDA